MDGKHFLTKHFYIVKFKKYDLFAVTRLSYLEINMYFLSAVHTSQ